MNVEIGTGTRSLISGYICFEFSIQCRGWRPLGCFGLPPVRYQPISIPFPQCKWIPFKFLWTCGYLIVNVAAMANMWLT
jgi:hypothetical protein